MGGALEKYLHEQGDEQGEEQEADATTTNANQTDAEPEPSLQESAHDLRQAVEGWQDRESAYLDTGADGTDVDAEVDGEQPRSAVASRRVFPQLITEEAESVEEQVYGAAAELVVE